MTEFIEKEFPLHRLGDVLNRLFNNSDPEVEGGHDHTSLYAPPHLVLRLAVCSFRS